MPGRPHRPSESLLPRLPLNSALPFRSKGLSYQLPGFTNVAGKGLVRRTSSPERVARSLQRATPEDTGEQHAKPEGGALAVRKSFSEKHHQRGEGSRPAWSEPLSGRRSSKDRQPQTARSFAGFGSEASEPLASRAMVPTPPATARPSLQIPQGIAAGASQQDAQRSAANTPGPADALGVPPPPAPPASSGAAAVQRKGRPVNAQRCSMLMRPPLAGGGMTPVPPSSAGTVQQLTGWLPKCHRCNSSFAQDSAKFCLQCGEARLERCHIGDAFHKIVGQRALLRKMDLQKFQRCTRELLESASRDASKSYRAIAVCVQSAFDTVMDEQLKEGVKSSQGIAIEFFEHFLNRVAQSLDLTLPSLLFGLLDQADTSFSLLDLGSVTQDHLANVRKRHTVEVLESSGQARSKSKAYADECTKCGSKFISNAKFCCECGEKQPERRKFDREAVHFFKGTDQWVASGFADESSIQQKDFEEVVSLAKKHQLPIEQVRKKQVEFQGFDTSKNGTLSYDEFAHAVRRYCSIPENEEIPSHLMNQAMLRASGGDSTGEIDFEMYLVWSDRVSCTEEMLVTDPNERNLRRLARNHGLPLTEVDEMKKLFDRFDTARKGYIQEADFRNMMASLLECSSNDIPESTVHRMWMELDSTHTGGLIPFDRFLVWSTENLAR